MYLVAGLIAALGAYIVNRYLLKRFGENIIVFITPIVEEVLKTGLAVYLNAFILPTHLIFGIVEGIYDFKTSHFGISAGLLSIIWHTFFGLVTIILTQLMGHYVYGLIAAILLHYIGNNIVINSKETRR